MDAVTTVTEPTDNGTLRSKQVLVWWYRKSRDQWKQRSAKLQEKLRGSKVNVRDLRQSRKTWRTRAEIAEGELREFRARAVVSPEPAAEPDQKKTHR